MRQRRDIAVLLLVIGGLALAALGLLVELRWVTAAGWLCAGAGGGLGVRDSIRKGVIETNWGTVRREDGPVRFRLEAAFWLLLVAAWTVGGVLCILGVIGTP